MYAIVYRCSGFLDDSFQMVNCFSFLEHVKFGDKNHINVREVLIVQPFFRKSGVNARTVETDTFYMIIIICFLRNIGAHSVILDLLCEDEDGARINVQH